MFVDLLCDTHRSLSPLAGHWESAALLAQSQIAVNNQGDKCYLRLGKVCEDIH